MRAILVLAAVCAACAQDWPQWRGPNRDGAVAGFSEPKAWPEKLRLKWKVQVGEGHSSPIVEGGRIYLHTRQGEREVVACRRADNGQVIWQSAYPAPYSVNPAAARHGKGVKSTPVVRDGRLFTLGIGGTLAGWDARTGKLQWRKESRPALYGTATSPVVDRGLVIAYLDALSAFDVATGAEKWSWKGDGPAYASPVIAEIAGTRQVITQSERNIIGVAESSGELLWRMPFTTPFEQNIITPVVYQQNLIFSGLGNGTMSVRVARRGSEWVRETLWHNEGISMYMSSPVVSGDVLYGMSQRSRGQFFALDLKTGATLWTSEPRQADNTAIVNAGGVLLLLKDDAELLVARKGAKGLETLRRYHVADSPTWAHPVICGNGILIKDATTLAYWEL